MKKAIMTLAALLGMCAAVSAQDTVPSTSISLKQNGQADTLPHDSIMSASRGAYNEDSLAYYVVSAIGQMERLLDSAMSNPGNMNDLMDSLGVLLNGKGLSKKLGFKPYPRFSGNLSFYRGFHNWGDKRLNGLGGMDGAYGLRTTFSSHQIEYMTNLKLSRHWMLGLGVAWESDRYKFRTPYVLATAAGLAEGTAADIAAREGFTSGALAQPGEWETHLVARYIEVPLRVGYTAGRFGRRLKMGISVIPGFHYNGKHTGLEYRAKVGGTDYARRDRSVDAYLNPFKCDLRFDIKRGLIGLFVQVPMMPVGKGWGVDMFPLKFGLFI